MNIGILGSGIVATTLANGFLKHGHHLKLGTRHPEKLTSWLNDAGPNASVGRFDEAARFGEILILSVSSAAAFEAIALAGKENFAGKPVIDLINPLDFTKGFPPKLTSLQGNSLSEGVQQELPDAHIIKAFNTVSVHAMTTPNVNGETGSLPICGNDSEAKQTFTSLASELGWDVVDLGGLAMAYWMESLAMMMILYGAKVKSTVGFRFLR